LSNITFLQSEFFSENSDWSGGPRQWQGCFSEKYSSVGAKKIMAATPYAAIKKTASKPPPEKHVKTPSGIAVFFEAIPTVILPSSIKL
jgi:hypothetical protein